MPGIEAHPDILDIFFVQPFQCGRIIDNNVFAAFPHVDDYDQPIMGEYFKIVKQHIFILFMKAPKGVTLGDFFRYRAYSSSNTSVISKVLKPFLPSL